MRQFKTGAVRDDDIQKLNYIGSLSPLVLRRFAKFMRDHNTQKDGQKRTENNWKKGMPKQSYIESKMRHFVDFWITHEGYEEGDIEDQLCADIFNAQGYLHELLVAKLKKKKPIKQSRKRFAKPVRVKFYTKEKLAKQVHYYPKGHKYLNTLCGLHNVPHRSKLKTTTDRKKVTCKTCLKSIKLWRQNDN